MPSGPSEEATGADAAASNPERDHVISNPFKLTRIKWQRKPVRGPGQEVEEKDPVGGGERSDETGETGTEDERRILRPVATEDPLGCREPTDSAPEGAPVSTAAREVFHDNSSHASGEAWAGQVRLH
ncbi:hypothetical protein NDU88_001133 [Pleurodeles waltl]|uniref:Uncharacterized protein n=1 Tax=Pleurodeles waltl TaxID=8319 RepID=A0AAV7TGY3_PLEWA|nr:hypothetical protein NDU88_001133 [Pleurodeles waltl]